MELVRHLLKYSSAAAYILLGKPLPRDVYLRLSETDSDDGVASMILLLEDLPTNDSDLLLRLRCVRDLSSESLRPFVDEEIEIVESRIREEIQRLTSVLEN